MAEAAYRNAVEEDVGLILDFIKKLADYEGPLSEVTATEDDLRKELFHLDGDDLKKLANL